MTALLIYVIHVTSMLALIWIFYSIALKRHTLYCVNRWYFILGIIGAFLLPSLPLPDRVACNPAVQQAAEQLNELDIILLFDYLTQPQPQIAETTLSAANLIIWSILGGIVLFVSLFCVRFASFVRLKRKAKSHMLGEAKIFLLQEDVKPFSFLGDIFLNPSMHSDTEIAEIITHEIFHIRQRHSIDMILAETLSIVSWFNPFVWLLRKAVRQNLEYLADRHVLQSGFDIMQYQYTLVRTGISGLSNLSIAHNFTFSNLKKRIIMMNKRPTPRIAMFKYLLLLPLIAFAYIGMHARAITKTLNEIIFIQQEAPVDQTILQSTDIHTEWQALSSETVDQTILPAADTVKRPLFYLNGQEIGSKEKINPSSIELISILKGDEAIKLFGEKAANGVVIFTTKTDVHGEYLQEVSISEAFPLRYLTDDSTRNALQVKKSTSDSTINSLITRRNSAIATNGEPLFIVNGKVTDRKNILPEHIETIAIIKKDDLAVELYGEEARNGVVVITLKPDFESSDADTAQKLQEQSQLYKERMSQIMEDSRAVLEVRQRELKEK